MSKKIDSNVDRVEIPIELIKIKMSFKKNHPKEKKILKCYNYYNKWNEFDRDIILNKEGELIDGYVAYLVAKMFDVKSVNVIIQGEI